MNAPRTPSAAPYGPPAGSRRAARLAVGLGGALLLASLAIAVIALRSHARDSNNSSPTLPPTSSTPRRAVAIGHVDVESGVTPLYPVQPGRVVKLDAHEGVAVKAGDPLLLLDDALARIQVDEARAALEGAQVQQKNAGILAKQHAEKVAGQKQAVVAAQKDVDSAQVQLDRARRRLENGTGATKEDVRLAELAVQKAETGVKAEQAKLAAIEALKPSIALELADKDVAAKQAQLRKAEYALKECTLRAPFAGTPLRILTSVGETLGPNPRQPALYFCPNSPRIIRAEVEQEFADRVKLGMAAIVQDDSTGSGDWRGKVERVSDWYSQRRSVLLEPLQFNDVRTLECIVTLDPNQAGTLRIGQRVRVILE
jgi:multidrug resistance efflux pump